MNFLVKWLLNSCISLFGVMFNGIGVITSELFNDTVIKGVLTGFKTIGLSFLAVAIIGVLIQLTLSIADGENIKIIDVGKRIIVGTVIWQFGATIFIALYQLLFNTAASLILTLSNHKEISMSADLLGNELLLTIMVLVAVFQIGKTFFQLFERFWQYFVYMCMLYFYIPGYIMGNEEAMFSWAKQAIAVCLTQIFQALLLVFGMVLFINSTSLMSFCVALGAITAASNVEKYLDRWGLGTGGGGKVKGMVQSGLSMAFYAKSFLR